MRKLVYEYEDEFGHKEIDLIEQQLNVSLPSSYRLFFKNNNAGQVDDVNGFITQHPTYPHGGFRFDRFHEMEEIVDEHMNLAPNHPKHILEFGSDILGNTFHIGISGDIIGKIFFKLFDEITEGADKENIFSYKEDFFLIANDFEEFIGLLGKNPH